MSVFVVGNQASSRALIRKTENSRPTSKLSAFFNPLIFPSVSGAAHERGVRLVLIHHLDTGAGPLGEVRGSRRGSQP